MAANPDPGLVIVSSVHTVEQTVQKLIVILRDKGVKLFALIDHSGEAELAGLQMRPTKLLIFGTPKLGTPLMVAAPTAAIDLPSKVLVWEDADGRVLMAYNDPAYLEARHGIPARLLENISVLEKLVAAAAA